MTETFDTPFPNYDVLDKWDSPSWNEQTRKVVAHRLENVPDRRFFDENAWDILVALCARVIPQPEREKPVPIAPFIDEQLYENITHGTQYASLPPQRAAWRRGIAALDDEARRRHEKGFVEIDDAERDALIRAVDDGDVKSQLWGDMPPRVFLRQLVLKDIVRIYYAHPAAWSEMGFGGPASPRGYLRLGIDRADPWEGREERRARVRGRPKP